MIYNNVLELIGNTPIVKYENNIYVKIESFNPSGSIKDRASYYMLKGAFERGEINKNTVIIEPTSGNTGIGLAMCCAVMGLKLIICMPENMSEERKKMMTAYGAELVLTPKEEGMKGSVDKAFELKALYPDSFIPMQFSNSDNSNSHEETANELKKDFENKSIVITAGIGTGGTAFGLKKYYENAIVYGVEPAESPLFTKGKSGSHKIQGIGANFIPEIAKENILDGILTVEGDIAISTAKEAAVSKGIFCGISAGANIYAAKELAKKFPNKDIVAIIPDGGERYLSVW
ncbi:MAG: pyridoxal-phosphate dependent enzyme [bacterium]|nr:pyridoxal-phosphate dependent enzyme [bacterium]